MMGQIKDIRNIIAGRKSDISNRYIAGSAWVIYFDDWIVLLQENKVSVNTVCDSKLVEMVPIPTKYRKNNIT